MPKSHKRARSGQIIVVSALIIALIMTSTAAYIYELSGNVGEADNSQALNDFVRSIVLGSKHVAIGALANITNGGQNQTLTANLNKWKVAVEQQFLLGTFSLNFTLRDIVPYSSGLYVNWGTNGSGVSGAYVGFLLKVSGKGIEMQYPYSINASTRLCIDGFITQITSETKQVMLYCHLLSEEQPALAKNVTVYYRESTNWMTPDATNNYTLTDYGNGTYEATFTLETSATSIDVSAHIFDERDIVVQANATLTQQ